MLWIKEILPSPLFSLVEFALGNVHFVNYRMELKSAFSILNLRHFSVKTCNTESIIENFRTKYCSYYYYNNNNNNNNYYYYYYYNNNNNNNNYYYYYYCNNNNNNNNYYYYYYYNNDNNYY